VVKAAVAGTLREQFTKLVGPAFSLMPYVFPITAALQSAAA
jgi:hypothetical protein